MNRCVCVRSISMRVIGAGLVLLAIASAASIAGVSAADPVPDGRRIAIVGDSITEARLYSKFVETYLLACRLEKAVVCQFGWSGESAAGFEHRMANDMLWFKPDVVLLCFGMNDGRYAAVTPESELKYAEPMGRIVEALQAQGVEIVDAGPGAVDTRHFRPRGADNSVTAAVYNATLGRLSALSSDLAVASGTKYADLHRLMMEAMTRAKQARGEDYEVCGRDGVHPAANGHLIMAYAFLKALGMSGDIGTIQVAMSDGSAVASSGHKVLSANSGRVELESTQYPFCFTDNPTDPTRAAGMLPFIPFNQELNRFMLKVDGLTWDRAKVTWGAASRVFSRAELESGINLAAEFADANPFSKAFGRVQSAVACKQEFETFLVKNWMTRVPALKKLVGDDAAGHDRFRNSTEQLVEVWGSLREGAVAAVVPVTHTIVIERANDDGNETPQGP